jgi:hypothetical protein
MSYLERLFAAQHDPRLPDDESRDVNREVMHTFLSGLAGSDLVPQDEVLDWVARVQQQDAAFTKAVSLQSHWVPKAEVERAGGRKALLYINELGVVGPGMPERWAEKPQGGGLEFLRYLANNLDVHGAIVFTRQHQVGSFARPYREDDNNPLGYRWVRRDGERLTKDDVKETVRLDQILQNSGTEFDPVARRYQYRRKTFQGFLAALVADTLTADACPIEVERSVRGEVLGWYNVPFDTIRLAHEDGYEGDDRIIALQLAPTERLPIIGFEPTELIYEVRNPRSALEYHDYGQAELEHFVRAATSYLNTFTFNAANLDRNSIPRGFLTVFGDYGPRQLTAFKSQWNSLVRGAAKRWSLPVLVSRNRQEGGAQWTAVDTSTTEMFMTKWLVFLVSLLCALFGMDPVEVNMEAFTSKVSSLSGKDTAEKLQSSKDRGFIPLMIWLESLLNEHLIGRITRKYRLTWVGLFPADEDRKFERQKLACTVDEFRAIDGEERHPDPDIGKAPVNSALLSIYTQKVLAAQQGVGPGTGDDDGEAFGLPPSERPLLPRSGAPSPRGRTVDRVGSGAETNNAATPMAKGRLVVEIRELHDEDLHGHA